MSTLVPFDVPEYLAQSTDIDVDNKIPGANIVGARIYITDTKVWKIVLSDLTLGDFTL